MLWLIKHHAVKMYEKDSHHQHQMDVSYHLHAMAALLPIAVGCEAGPGPEQVWLWW
jgi:hypothetical protein